MFKDTVTYTDWDSDTKVTDTLWFNISKTDLAGNLALMDRISEMDRNLKGPERELTTPEKQEILDLVKTFMSLAYGVKSADGKHFRKTPELWEDFKSTAAYDEYLWGLFLEARKAFGFILAVLPKEFQNGISPEARKELEELSIVPEATGEVTDLVKANEPVQNDDRPDWLKEGRAPSMAELKATPQKYHAEGFRLKMESASE